jgi:TolB-like protein/DNA-binding winged helix-turn-helix (wHTH) protein
MADLVVDTATRQVWRDGAELNLTGLSFDLLKSLMDVGTRVVTTDELMDRVWPGRVVNAETVGKRVELVREALGDNSQEPRYIALVRGRGYRLLHAPQADSGSQPDSVPLATAPTAVPRSGRVAIVAGLLAVVLGLVVVFGVLNRGQRAAPTPQAVVASETPSVAVLPFLNLSEDAANAYFSDGMAEELLGTLSKLSGLRVASRTSAFTFKGSKQPLPEIARQLNVDHIVEGSVRKAGNRIRVTIQLIDVRSDSHLWAETYDRELADALDIQREIAEKIAAALKLEFEPGVRVTQGAGTRNIEAWQLYLRGTQLWQARGESGIRQSIGMLERAIELDPEFAEAHSSLASAHLLAFFWYANPVQGSLDQAEKHAQRAITLEPTLSLPYGIRAELAETRHDWSEAEILFRDAIRLNPNDATSGYWYAVMLMITGRTRDALAALHQSEQLDPILVGLLYDLMLMYDYQGDMKRACSYFSRAKQVSSSIGPLLRTAECAEFDGNPAAVEEAERTAERILKLDKPFTLLRRARTDPAAAQEVRAAILEAKGVSGGYFIENYIMLGEIDTAFDELERTVFSGDFRTLRFLWLRDGQKMRAHPRFRPFVEKIGLVDYWRKSGWPDICRPVGESFTCD